MRTALRIVTLGVALGLAAAPAALAGPPGDHVNVPAESFDEYVPGAGRLEGRLLAPCCWDSSRQTLDIHGSPVSNELRREIRKRLRAGEGPDAIEADLVRRYTTKILAAPAESPLPNVGPVLTAGLVVAGVFAALTIARWRRRSRDALGAPRPASADGPKDEWDARLDRELEEKD